MINRKLFYGTSLAMLLSVTAFAGVPPEVAARLGNDLTPMGSQKSGNKDGTIPEWTGGLQSPPANVTYKIGDRHPDPYADDKVLFTITAANMAQYEKNLGVLSVGMLKAYPETYKMNVYPTHRSCAQPPAVYEVIKSNALNSVGAPDGAGFSGAIRSTAFPIPSVTQEMMWNHTLKFRDYKFTRQLVFAAPTRGGDFTAYVDQNEGLIPFSDPSKTDVSQLNNISFYYISNTVAPARSAGNVVLVHETINVSEGARKAWVYSPGTRRVRRAPNIAYDNPLTNSDGLDTTDNFGGFNGATDRYDWTYVGRQETYMPNNNYRFAQRDLQYKDILIPGGHMKMDYLRYELQRAHVLEANVRASTRHLYPRRQFWMEEDSWFILQNTAYDARGNLWRLHEQFAMTYYEGPVCDRVGATTNDLNAGRYLAGSLVNQEAQISWKADELQEDRYTPDAIRRLGVR
ncbi:MAG: DUF1329 domain-containing protein [Alphaproteobacteria bacterium]|nr:DUF1329 domain-containing protein [Alphaproteobacteria bacterium]